MNDKKKKDWKKEKKNNIKMKRKKILKMTRNKKKEKKNIIKIMRKKRKREHYKGDKYYIVFKFFAHYHRNNGNFLYWTILYKHQEIN